MRKLFGTDGIRGVANEYPMTSEMALRVGQAVAAYYHQSGEGSKIIVGKDTRISGHMLEHALLSGICSVGGDAYITGIMPTPGVAYLTASINASAGVVISASHNPFYDNGIKLFNGDGFKLSDQRESEIEKLILNETFPADLRAGREPGAVHHIKNSHTLYAEFLKHTLKAYSFNGLTIALDCANGATYAVAPQLFSDLDAHVDAFGVHPDGKNINDACGSEHPENLITRVVQHNADLGLAFDGDGDRLIAVDEQGKILTGDQILAICAKVMKQKGKLKNNLVVSTVMSNMGLGVALKAMGIRHVTSSVGDRYVMQEMVACGAVIGGEDSGHMIFLDHHTTGDGMLTALMLIDAMLTENKPLSELSNIMTVYPQVLLNVEVKSKPDIKSIPGIVNAIKSVEIKLGDQGRVLVRYSGTQALCRVMVEGPDERETHSYCRQIADAIQLAIGI